MGEKLKENHGTTKTKIAGSLKADILLLKHQILFPNAQKF